MMRQYVALWSSTLYKEFRYSNCPDEVVGVDSFCGDKHDMAIVDGSLIEITLNMVQLAQQSALVFQYEVVGIAPGVTPVQIAEAWWSDVKASTRALAQTALFGLPFRTVVIRELNNPAGDYATFDIPPAEQGGTRTTGSGEAMPPFNAVGVRLVVGTRTTRPGQKRLPFLTEGDNLSGALGAGMVGLVQTWAANQTALIDLGAPAALTGLQPIVTRKDAQGFVTAWQPVTGYLINPNITSQNSRKIGRGI